MTTRTLDVEIDEIALMARLLGEFVAQQNQALRDTYDPVAGEGCSFEQIRTNIEIATRLRGKLPL